MESRKMINAVQGIAGDTNILNALIPHLPYNVQQTIASRRTIRRNGKTNELWAQIDFQIREQKFPILYLCKPAPAVIISQEEYKKLKALDDEREEKLYHMVCETIDEVLGKSFRIHSMRSNKKIRKLVEKYEKRPKE